MLIRQAGRPAIEPARLLFLFGAYNCSIIRVYTRLSQLLNAQVK